MSSPVRSFVGGLGLAVPVHALLILNGSVFGISGFLHRVIRGDGEAIAATAGLIAGGIAVSTLGDISPASVPSKAGLWQTIGAGLLVGVGTKMSNGCTSGHMICGLSRFSRRSLVATATFFSVAAVTTSIFHGNSYTPLGPADYSLGPAGEALLKLQLVPWAISALLYFWPSYAKPSDEAPPRSHRAILRLLASSTTAFSFSLALRLSNLTEPSRVISFLLLPLHKSFDPSLLYLAVGVLPLSTFLYWYAQGSGVPRLGGKWSVPNNGTIDIKLVIGAAIFGIGWGLGGICPGPGLVNLGRGIARGSYVLEYAVWLSSVVFGGFLI